MPPTYDYSSDQSIELQMKETNTLAIKILSETGQSQAEINANLRVHFKYQNGTNIPAAYCRDVFKNQILAE